jgi:hypothetical protein
MAVSRILFSHRQSDLELRSFILPRQVGAGAALLGCD